MICARPAGDWAYAGCWGGGYGGVGVTNLRLLAAGIPGQADERRGRYYVTPYWERPWLL